MSKYWDITKILPYQRCFNLINGKRSIGKSYTTEKYLLNKAIYSGMQFVYIVRTQDEKKKGALEKGFSKVILLEFTKFKIECDTECMYNVVTDEEGNVTKEILGFCIALSEYIKIKKQSYPNVKYIMFDEYMLESNNSIAYFNGWKEPEVFLNIYHTIDREQDKVICFMLGNNTSFYNPYHIHPAFSIPEKVKKGEIWYSENVLFQWAESSRDLDEEKSKSKFLKMISGTDYSKYAKDGDYVYDNKEFLAKRSSKAKFIFTINYEGLYFGIWKDNYNGVIYIDDKYDPSCKLIYALTLEDHKENTLLTKNKNNTLLKWLGNNFKLGNVRFNSMETKIKIEKGLVMIL